VPPPESVSLEVVLIVVPPTLEVVLMGVVPPTHCSLALPTLTARQKGLCTDSSSIYNARVKRTCVLQVAF